MLIPLPPRAEQHRIVAKIEELLPYVDRYAQSWEKLEHFNAKFPEDMKKSILQYAIQGKLVEQRAEDGTAEELYQQIQAEKQKLITEGKIKKEKPLPEITENEIPFDIPDGWKWVHLNNIAVSNLGKTLNKSSDIGDECPYLCSINVYWEGISTEKIKTAKFDEDEKKKYLLQKGDLLICEGGDAGRSAIWTSDEIMYYQNALHRVRFYGGVNPKFYCYLLECYKKTGVIANYTKGIGIQHLVQASLNAMWIPLPPLAEQHRIVAKIEELLPYCDRLVEK
jgi:type I restriction enzyme S subunit